MSKDKQTLEDVIKETIDKWTTSHSVILDKKIASAIKDFIRKKLNKFGTIGDSRYEKLKYPERVIYLSLLADVRQALLGEEK